MKHFSRHAEGATSLKTQRTTLPEQITPHRDPRRWLMLATVQYASLMGILDAARDRHDPPAPAG